MDDASKRLIDCVIVWKYDRFARSLSVLVPALQQFNSLGIDFISYTQSIDTTTPMGRLFYNVIGSFAEFEKEMIVELKVQAFASGPMPEPRVSAWVDRKKIRRQVSASSICVKKE